MGEVIVGTIIIVGMLIFGIMGLSLFMAYVTQNALDADKDENDN